MTGRWVTLLPLALLGVACGDTGTRSQELQYSGATMGTTFSVSIVRSDQDVDTTVLQSDIGAALQQIEKTMSTYDAESELSMFNADTSADWVPVSYLLCEAIEESLQLARFTDGAFDITVGPLVNLWGFGPSGVINEPPSSSDLQDIRSHIGFEKLDADCANARIRKSDDKIYVDLSAYAKGLGVDWLADVLLAHHLQNFLVEIGGEIRVHGTNGSDEHWRVAIEKPVNNERTVEKNYFGLWWSNRNIRRLPKLLRTRWQAILAHHRSAYRPTRRSSTGRCYSHS